MKSFAALERSGCQNRACRLADIGVALAELTGWALKKVIPSLTCWN